MGFAAGMRAGQLAVEGAIDQYKDARRNRDIRDVEKELAAMQQASAERQYGTDRASATTGLGAQQQRQAVMPQAPSATGLSLQEQAAMVAPGVPGRTAPAPSVTGLSMEQQAGLMQEPLRPSGEYVPMSQQAIEQLRADRLRGLGYDEDADRAMGRAMALRQEQREIEQTGFERGVTEQQEERADTRLTMQEQEFEQRAELLGFEIKDARRRQRLLTAMDSFKGMTPNAIINSQQYKDLPIAEKTQAAAMLGNLAKSEVEAGTAFLSQKFKGLSEQKVLSTINGDETITKGSSYGITQKEGKDEGVVLSFTDDETGKPLAQPKEFDTETQAIEYLRAQAIDPGSAAVYYQSVYDGMESRAIATAAAMQDRREFAIEEVNDLQAEFFDADSVWGRMAVDDPEAYREAKKTIFAPLENYFTEDEWVSFMNAQPDPSEEQSDGILKRLFGSDDPASDATVIDTEASSETPAAISETPAASEVLTSSSPKLDPFSDNVAERRAAAGAALSNVFVAGDEEKERQLEYAARGGRPLGGSR
jgi:hypothetical protein